PPAPSNGLASAALPASGAQPAPASQVADDADGWVGIVGSAPRAVAAGLTSATPAPTPSPESRHLLAAPLVRKLARDRGVQLEDVPGSGPQGRVRVADLDAFLAAGSVPPPAPVFSTASPAADVERVPLQGLRKRIADHL